MTYTAAMPSIKKAHNCYINNFGYLLASSYTARQPGDRGALQQLISVRNILSGSIAFLVNGVRSLGESPDERSC
jgi:hypothetical protein